MGKTQLSTKIKEYRQQLGFTQESLAEMVGVRRETIVFLEQGKYVPSLKLAYDISRALNASIDNLFFFS